MNEPIYLDFNASTPLCPEAREAWLTAAADHGNPSAGHRFGQAARRRVDFARQQTADLLGCEPDEVYFTSGGTEAANWAIKGTFDRVRRRDAGFHAVTSAVEHPATLKPLEYLESRGATVARAGVGVAGTVDPAEVEAALLPETRLAAFMHAQNETGAIQPIAEIAERLKGRGVAYYVDAAQSAGKVPIDVRELGADLLSIAGHKLYAPKGVGALFVRRGLEIEPLMHGAGHERGRRAGTEATAQIAALGAACAAAKAWLPEAARQKALRDRFWSLMRERFGARVTLHAEQADRLPNTLFVSFLGVRGAEALAATPGIAASTGSACHTGRSEQSPTLAAMGVAEEVGRGAVRFSLGRETDEATIERAVSLLAAALADLRPVG
ncbi:MAG TPA: cysteine desulfurase family protein [Planctomycetia bacterium]|nr:cysteine desulfurase family protein [Planctomycetia bacterium]